MLQFALVQSIGLKFHLGYSESLQEKGEQLFQLSKFLSLILRHRRNLINNQLHIAG